MAAFAASVITASPTFISPEEHAVVQASTPTSFDIPPVLRKKQADVRLQLNPPLEGFPEPSQGDGIKGDLYVTTEALAFFSPSLSKGISFPYPAIALHAVSRQAMRPWHPPADEGDDNTPAAPAPLDGVGLAGGPCIYCQIDEAGGTEADAEAEDGYEGIIRDLVLTPTDASAIEPIFEAISHCASLHPSHLDDDDDGPTFGDGFAQADDDDLDDVGRAARDRLEALIDFNAIPAGFVAPTGLGAGGDDGARTADADEGDDSAPSGGGEVNGVH